MNNLKWYIIGTVALAIAVVFSWLAFDLSRRDKDIATLRAQTEQMGSAVAKAAVDRDVALAKCRVLETALLNARKRELITATTGRETSVSVSPAGETVTTTVEPSITVTEITSNPTLPEGTTMPGSVDTPPVTAPVGTTTPNTAAGRVYSLSLLYETDGSVGLLLMRDWKRLRIGAGFSFKQRGIITAGFVF